VDSFARMFIVKAESCRVIGMMKRPITFYPPS
jgi:hypothetical protein